MEHAPFPFSSGGSSQAGYFNRLGLPNVYVSSRTRAHCKKNCSYPVVVNEKGDLLYSGNNQDTIRTVSSGRYENIAYLQFKHLYPCGDDTCQRSYLIDQNNYRYPLLPSHGGYDSLISKDRHLYEVSSSGLYVDAHLQVKSPKDFELGRLSNNPQGDIVAAAVDEQGRLYTSDTKKWVQSSIQLSEHGDRSGILALYPKDDHSLVLGIYKYTNIYNKGLIAAEIDLDQKSEHAGWLFNSAKRNVGFDPEIYWEDGVTTISATDSSNKERISTQLSDSDYLQLASAQNYPEHIKGFEYEEAFSFLVGTRLAYNKWSANSYVQDEDSNTYSDMRYDIGDTLYSAIYFEGRIYNIQLGVSYLQNWVEKQGTTAKIASKLFSGFVSFNDLFSKSSSLRIELEQAQINGEAYYERKSTTITTGPSNKHLDFQQKYTDIAAKVMFERGWFVGAEYMAFTLPSAVGFSDTSKEISYLTLDKSLSMQNYLLVAGYDEISYARRYESDLSRFYVQGNLGLGLSVLNLSSQTQQEVENSTSKSILSPSSFILTGEANLGYIFQSRFKRLRGFGYALTTGAKVRGSWSTTGQSKKSDNTISSDEIHLELERYDLWYGPYVSFNLLF